MTDPFATADQADGYSYPLPDDRASGLLNRATQMLIDAAGYGILSASSVVRLQAEHGVLSLRDVPLVTAVADVVLSHADGTTGAVSTWHWPGLVAGAATDVWLGEHVPERHCGFFAVTLTQGLAETPDSLVMLTCAVAYRLAAMPAAMAAGVTSRTVGSVSWAASSPPPSDDLTGSELCKLAKIVPVKHVWQVPA